MPDIAGNPPTYINHGSYRGHRFVILWSVGEPLRLITAAVLKWQQQGLFPVSTAYKIIGFLEEEYINKRLAWLTAMEEEEIDDGQ